MPASNNGGVVGESDRLVAGDVLPMSRLGCVVTCMHVMGGFQLLAQNCSCFVIFDLISDSDFAHLNNYRAESCCIFVVFRRFESSWLNGGCIHDEARGLIEMVSLVNTT